MCINFETSIGSFIMGLISSIILQLQKDNGKKNMGKFVIFFSLIQLFEAIIYKQKNKQKIFSKMILLNLGYQGFIFFHFMSKNHHVRKEYKFISLLIAIIITLYVIKLDDFVKIDKKLSCIDKEGCLTWNFMEDKNICILLSLMYFMIFMWLFTSNDKKMFKCGILLLSTFIFSYFTKNISNSPSFWCMTSAIISPLFIIL
jgi:hypothetical protein